MTSPGSESQGQELIRRARWLLKTCGTDFGDGQVEHTIEGLMDYPVIFTSIDGYVSVHYDCQAPFMVISEHPMDEACPEDERASFIIETILPHLRRYMVLEDLADV